jgi:hypothetical protein
LLAEGAQREHRPVLELRTMKSEIRRLNKLTGASRSVAKPYKLTTAAAEIIDQAGQIHGQKSRAVQIAVEILWRTVGLVAEIPDAILQSPMTGRTYKLPRRTVSLVEALAREGYRTQGEVLAACAGLLTQDVKEAKSGGLVKPRRPTVGRAALVSAST